MFDKLVRDTHAVYIGMVSVVGHEFQYGTSETSLDGAVLESYDILILASYLVKNILVDGLEVTHVVVGSADALGRHSLYGLGGQIAYGADAEYGYVVTVT